MLWQFFSPDIGIHVFAGNGFKVAVQVRTVNINQI
jgi:hypothetical protein